MGLRTHFFLRFIAVDCCW